MVKKKMREREIQESLKALLHLPLLYYQNERDRGRKRKRRRIKTEKVDSWNGTQRWSKVGLRL